MDTPDSTTPLKTCNKCGKEFPATGEYFPLKKNGTPINGCRECARRKTAEWRKEHPDAAAEWRAAHPDYQKHWYEENRDKHLAQTKDRYEQNPRKKLDANKQWKENNPERRKLLARTHQHRRRSAKRASPEQHTAEDIAIQYRSQKGKCWWCGKPVGDDYHIDHRIPLARGGGNGPGNIVISCPECNWQKKAKLPHEWNGRLL